MARKFPLSRKSQLKSTWAHRYQPRGRWICGRLHTKMAKSSCLIADIIFPNPLTLKYAFKAWIWSFRIFFKASSHPRRIDDRSSWHWLSVKAHNCEDDSTDEEEDNASSSETESINLISVKSKKEWKLKAESCSMIEETSKSWGFDFTIFWNSIFFFKGERIHTFRRYTEKHQKLLHIGKLFGLSKKTILDDRCVVGDFLYGVEKR